MNESGKAGTTEHVPGSGLQLRNIRTDEALARFAGDASRLRHWLRDFCAYGAQQSEAIAQAIDAGETDAAISRTHALKGRCGMLGMVELHAIAQTLELALRNGEPSRVWLDELTRSVAETRADIESVLGGA